MQNVYSLPAKSQNVPLILVAVKNEMSKRSPNFIYEKIENELKTLSKMRFVYITSTPSRLDIHSNNPIHENIVMANNYIKEVVLRMENVHFIDLNILKRFHFSEHGLHLNLRGKRNWAI